jgi:hypothetical protein
MFEATTLFTRSRPLLHLPSSQLGLQQALNLTETKDFPFASTVAIKSAILWCGLQTVQLKEKTE